MSEEGRILTEWCWLELLSVEGNGSDMSVECQKEFYRFFNICDDPNDDRVSESDCALADIYVDCLTGKAAPDAYCPEGTRLISLMADPPRIELMSKPGMEQPGFDVASGAIGVGIGFVACYALMKAFTRGNKNATNDFDRV